MLMLDLMKTVHQLAMPNCVCWLLSHHMSSCVEERGWSCHE